VIVLVKKANEIELPKKRGPGAPRGSPAPKSAIKPGEVRNPHGISKERARVRDMLTIKLNSNADDIFDTWMKLIKQGNVHALLRAVDVLMGKPKEHVQIETPEGARNVDALRSEFLAAIVPRVKRDDVAEAEVVEADTGKAG